MQSYLPSCAMFQNYHSFFRRFDQHFERVSFILFFSQCLTQYWWRCYDFYPLMTLIKWYYNSYNDIYNVEVQYSIFIRYIYKFSNNSEKRTIKSTHLQYIISWTLLIKVSQYFSTFERGAVTRSGNRNSLRGHIPIN